MAPAHAGVTVHLRLPTSFCSPNFAYLMVSDARDALRRVRGIGAVTVLLEDHHDSDKINAGIAADAGYLGTFGAEAEEGLDALRLTFQRKAHTAAMERCVMAALTAGSAKVEDLGRLTLGDLPAGRTKEALLRRRTDIGLGVAPGERVVVDELGAAVPDEQLPLRLRLATSVRISIEGNAHFCRGLLATRYAEGDETPSPPRSPRTRGAHQHEHPQHEQHQHEHPQHEQHQHEHRTERFSSPGGSPSETHPKDGNHGKGTAIQQGRPSTARVRRQRARRRRQGDARPEGPQRRAREAHGTADDHERRRHDRP